MTGRKATTAAAIELVGQLLIEVGLKYRDKAMISAGRDLIEARDAEPNASEAEKAKSPN